MVPVTERQKQKQRHMVMIFNHLASESGKQAIEGWERNSSVKILMSVELFVADGSSHNSFTHNESLGELSQSLWSSTSHTHSNKYTRTPLKHTQLLDYIHHRKYDIYKIKQLYKIRHPSPGAFTESWNKLQTYKSTTMQKQSAYLTLRKKNKHRNSM